MKRIVIALAALSFTTPANALTWKEFWEPFVEYSNHHHHSGYGGSPHKEDGCYRVDYDYYYTVPGYYDGRRWVPSTQRVEGRSKWVNCHRHNDYHYHSPYHHH